MAANDEPRTRYPQQEVAEGQEHGYIGEDVEVYDPATGKAVGKGQKVSEVLKEQRKAGVPQGKTGTIKADDTADDDSAPAAGGKS